ncbi:MAG: 3-hydroxyacyl-CoA dehydrogenase family protein, partial [Desulfocucumaceae bacterium]
MKVAVIGSGVMGPGIAQTWLTAGHQVAIADISAESLEEGKARIKDSLSQLHERKLLEKGADLYMPLLTTTTSLPEAVGNASLVIECVAERPDVKQAVYNELDRHCPPDAVVVSNTSALPLPDMFPDFRPERFFICHYFNPPEISPLV